MISFENVAKSYQTTHGKLNVLSDVNFTVSPGEKIGLLGRNGAGKSTLLRLLGGVERPSSGTIRRDMTVSWPLAFTGAFQNSLTGLDNLKFICRVYDTPHEPKAEFVDDFSELGRFLREPVRTYSSGMRARLAFAISMAIDFDCYLIDEVMAVGDDRFQEKCAVELFEKRKHCAMIMASHTRQTIEARCTSAFLLRDGSLTQHLDLNKAFESYAGLPA